MKKVKILKRNQKFRQLKLKNKQLPKFLMLPSIRIRKRVKLLKLQVTYQPKRAKFESLFNVQPLKAAGQLQKRNETHDLYKLLFQEKIQLHIPKGFVFRVFGRLCHMKKKLSLLTSISKKIKGINKFRSAIIASENGFKSNSRLAYMQNPIFRLYTKFLFAKKIENYKFLNSIYVKRFTFEQIKQKAGYESVYGFRVLRNLPIRGQRTKTNSRSARSYFSKNKIFENLND
jgi:ribosomal protein S13